MKFKVNEYKDVWKFSAVKFSNDGFRLGHRLDIDEKSRMLWINLGKIGFFIGWNKTVDVKTWKDEDGKIYTFEEMIQPMLEAQVERDE